MDIEFVRSRFIKHFDGLTGNIYHSPGRINLIGEHTDYVSISSASIPTTTADMYFREQLLRE